jgi:hypothetical protein
MSVKVSKQMRKAGIKAARRQAREIANEQIRELLMLPCGCGLNLRYG